MNDNGDDELEENENAKNTKRGRVRERDMDSDDDEESYNGRKNSEFNDKGPKGKDSSYNTTFARVPSINLSPRTQSPKSSTKEPKTTIPSVLNLSAKTFEGLRNPYNTSTSSSASFAETPVSPLSVNTEYRTPQERMLGKIRSDSSSVGSNGESFHHSQNQPITIHF